jgi:hypothetical protein
VASVVELSEDPEEPDEDEVGSGVVPETTGGPSLMLLSCRSPQTLISTPPLAPSKRP